MGIFPPHARIGIWGFGISGQAAADFFYKKGHLVTVMDCRALSPEERDQLATRNIRFCHQSDLAAFFEQCDYVIPSPIIDINSLTEHQKRKIVTELDVFYAYAQEPIIAITGTVGKTSVTTLLSQLLTSYGLRILMGGNIGIPMLSLVDSEIDCDFYVLEASNLQLRFCTRFSPFVAILLNFSPNHLDWHGTQEDYFSAKCMLFAYQKKESHAVLPLSLVPHVKEKVSLVASVHCISPEEDQTRMNFPPITFTDNWLTLITVIRLLDLPLDRLTHYAAACAIPAHRLEKVATIRGITFYNDSKSTIGAATLAAVRSLPQKPILLLGGLSKGVDRQNLICVLAHTVKAIICFGAEREQLFAWCCDYTIPACAHASLRDAFFAGVAIAQPGDTLLLSPAGSSFDLFDDYKARGTAFNQLVQEFHTTVQSTYAPSGISSAISDPGDSMAGIDGN